MKVIFIDFGGVYFKSSDKHTSKIFSKKFNVPYKKLLGAMTGSNWSAHATGRRNEKQYWKHVSDELGINEKQTHQLRDSLYKYSPINKGMAPLIRKLRKKYTVAALSSISGCWIEYFEKKHKISKHFDDHQYTYIHGIDKPHAKFFLSAARKMKVKPKDCIVVDDKKIFLTNVKKTGAKTILFKDAEQLQKSLVKMGVEV